MARKLEVNIGDSLICLLMTLRFERGTATKELISEDTKGPYVHSVVMGKA